jgi:hypothetical protein
MRDTGLVSPSDHLLRDCECFVKMWFVGRAICRVPRPTPDDRAHDLF